MLLDKLKQNLTNQNLEWDGRSLLEGLEFWMKFSHRSALT